MYKMSYYVKIAVLVLGGNLSLYAECADVSWKYIPGGCPPTKSGRPCGQPKRPVNHIR